MLVYGDREAEEDAAGIVEEIKNRLDLCGATEPGLNRHQNLVGAFIRTAELVQSISDAEFHHIGADEMSAQQDQGNKLLLLLASAVRQSWTSGFAETGASMSAISSYLDALSSASRVKTKQAEGFAFYALYPEAYLEAARRSGLGSQTMVIGIRSIGAGLAALVAAALDAAPAVTVRPVGHPFDRKLALGQRLAQRLVAHQGSFAIADEGPGLSGSSFNSVADWLTEHGVAQDRIHFFPSHSGDLGSAAQERHRQRWSGARRHVVGMDELLLQPLEPSHHLAHWISQLVGPVDEPLLDLSGGDWRNQNAHSADAPADPAMERRKFLASSAKSHWLAKYSGIGKSGGAKLQLAERLADAGFTPRPQGLCHGFLVMPWLRDDRQPGEAVPHERVLQYLALRASIPPLGSGASLAELYNMAQYNIGQYFGPEAADLITKALGEPLRFNPEPCCTDNRMHSWEWIKHDGNWLKLDGLDHHASHDLIGCQDIVWDLAGAAVEAGLSRPERDAWTKDLSQRIGRPIEPECVAAYELCYLGFQIGLWTMALDRNNDRERPRIDRQLRYYAAHRALRDIGITCVKP